MGTVCFADKCTSSFQDHKAILDVAMAVDERKDHFLAKDLDCDRVHDRELHVATFKLSPLFVRLHKSIL